MGGARKETGTSVRWSLILTVALAGCAGIEDATLAPSAGEGASSSVQEAAGGHSEPVKKPAGSEPRAPVEVPEEPREVTLQVSIETDDGSEVEGGMTYEVVGPHGGRLGGGGTSSGTMPIEAREGMVVRLSVSEVGYIPVTLEFVARWSDEPQVVIVMLRRVREPATLRLHVSDDGGAHPEHVYVSIENRAGDAIAGFWKVKLPLDGEGSGALGKLPPGEYCLLVMGSAMFKSFLVPTRVPVAFKEGATTEVSVTLTTGGYVRAILPPRRGEEERGEGPWLYDAEGKEVEGLWSTVTPEGAAKSPRRPGPAIHWHAVAPGRYIVEFGPEEGNRFRTEAIVRPGEVTEVEVRYPEDR